MPIALQCNIRHPRVLCNIDVPKLLQQLPAFVAKWYRVAFLLIPRVELWV